MNRYTLTCLSQNEDHVLYVPRDASDPSRLLSDGSQFSLAYTLEPKLNVSQDDNTKDDVSELHQQHVSTRMGALAIDWCPVPLEIPTEASTILGTGHGPLKLSSPLSMELAGPFCYIESAPFETRLESVPSAPRVAIPFQVSFSILNKTGLLQKLSVVLADSSSSSSSAAAGGDGAASATVKFEQPEDHHGILIAGLVNGEITLSPFERQTLSYTALATRAGETYLPALSVTSLRYNSFVIREEHMTGRSMFILP